MTFVGKQDILPSWFSPSITNNYAGDPKIEERVVRDVASFGKQIGWLSEIAKALAEGKPAPAEPLEKLAKAMAKVEAIKKEVADGASEAAHKALDRLKEESPEAFESLIRAEAYALDHKRADP